jgi:ParB-like chromosome segregation protein Spo0J
MLNEPINRIQWKDASELRANDYNPNRVHKAEWRLLRESILKTGWVQPILANVADLIIDGFHRWRMVLDDAQVRAKTGGLVPTVTLDVDEPTAMLMTVQMNRAKGSHASVSMSDLVKRVIRDHKYSIEDVMRGMGASRLEVETLLMDDVFQLKNISAWKYSEAWYPSQ